jgi:hypothetical protein
MLGGEWNPKEFLVVPPSHRIAASYDDGVISWRRDHELS